jgi:hypothetical protein
MHQVVYCLRQLNLSNYSLQPAAGKLLLFLFPIQNEAVPAKKRPVTVLPTHFCELARKSRGDQSLELLLET